jgi:sugar lactone lactonase YvrE
MTTRTVLARATVGVLLIAGMLAAAQNSAEARDLGKIGPPLETVKQFGDDFRLVGIGVSTKGRVFATAPSSQIRSRFSMVEVDPKTNAVVPYPDAAWNNFSDQRDGKSEWISVQALWVDKKGHLWALDSSLPKVDEERLPAKLVEFDLSSNRVIRQYDFKGIVSEKYSLNDVRVDNLHDYAYLTNAGNQGSLVVLDLKTRKARQVLVGDRSTFADPGQHLMIGNRVAMRPDGSVKAVQADGIALSPDAQWL